MINTNLGYFYPGSTPTSLKTVISASTAALWNACIAGEIYEVVTTCFLDLTAASITSAWKVYGMRLITRSCSEMHFSSSALLLTSNAIGTVFSNPLQRLAELDFVLEATVTLFSGRLSKCFRQGRATNPFPSSRILLVIDNNCWGLGYK